MGWACSASGGRGARGTAADGDVGCVRAFVGRLRPELARVGRMKVGEDVDARVRHERTQAMREEYEDAEARLASETAYWVGVRRQLARQGMPLRVAIQTSLTVANRTGRGAGGFIWRRMRRGCGGAWGSWGEGWGS